MWISIWNQEQGHSWDRFSGKCLAKQFLFWGGLGPQWHSCIQLNMQRLGEFSHKSHFLCFSLEFTVLFFPSSGTQVLWDGVGEQVSTQLKLFWLRAWMKVQMSFWYFHILTFVENINIKEIDLLKHNVSLWCLWQDLVLHALSWQHMS